MGANAGRIYYFQARPQKRDPGNRFLMSHTPLIFFAVKTPKKNYSTVHSETNGIVYSRATAPALISTSSLSAPGAQIVFFPVSLYRFLRLDRSLHPFACRGFWLFGQT